MTGALMRAAVGLAYVAGALFIVAGFAGRPALAWCGVLAVLVALLAVSVAEAIEQP